MIKSLTVISHLGEKLYLEMTDPEKSGFAITDITGLGPGTATINISETATNDGGIYNSARLGPRNIVLTLQIVTKLSNVETLRQKLYKYFAIKKKIRLELETDNRHCSIEGYVESNEPVMFSKNPSTQISIMCPDPYFYSVDVQTTMFAGVEPLFEFPFSNESRYEPLIVFGNIQNTPIQTVYYEGDSEIGAVITIHALGPATNILVYNVVTHAAMSIDTALLTILTGSGLIAGDDIIISTIKGKKSITLIRDGIRYNILSCLGRNSNWLQLVRGDNLLSYTAETGSLNLNFSIENQIVYEGI